MTFVLHSDCYSNVITSRDSYTKRRCGGCAANVTEKIRSSIVGNIMGASKRAQKKSWDRVWEEGTHKLSLYPPKRSYYCINYP